MNTSIDKDPNELKEGGEKITEKTAMLEPTAFLHLDDGLRAEICISVFLKSAKLVHGIPGFDATDKVGSDYDSTEGLL
jgi:hypothetical protein